MKIWQLFEYTGSGGDYLENVEETHIDKSLAESRKRKREDEEAAAAEVEQRGIVFRYYIQEFTVFEPVLNTETGIIS